MIHQNSSWILVLLLFRVCRRGARVDDRLRLGGMGIDRMRLRYSYINRIILKDASVLIRVDAFNMLVSKVPTNTQQVCDQEEPKDDRSRRTKVRLYYFVHYTLSQLEIGVGYHLN